MTRFDVPKYMPNIVELPQRFQLTCCLPDCDETAIVDESPFALPYGWVRLQLFGLVYLPEKTYCSMLHAEAHVLREVRVIVHDKTVIALLSQVAAARQKELEKFSAQHAFELAVKPKPIHQIDPFRVPDAGSLWTEPVEMHEEEY